MEEHFKQIEAIQKQISEYYEMTFANEEDDYDYNKSIKEKLKQIIAKSNLENVQIKEQALLVLAESTGCAEDHDISEAIIDDLFESNIINKEQLDFFYTKIATGRWE